MILQKKENDPNHHTILLELTATRQLKFNVISQLENLLNISLNQDKTKTPIKKLLLSIS